MKESKISIVLITFLFVFLLIPVKAYASITIDGYLNADWGVTPGSYGSSDWTPNAGILSKVEDQIADKLTPGYGGQKFDAEALYWTWQEDKIYIAIVTGMQPAGWPGGTPGDIYINFGPGRTYGIKTTGANAGHLYRNPTWNGSGNWSGSTDPTTIKNGGTDLGLIDFKYLYTYPTGAHYVMEMAIPDAGYFGYDDDFGGTIHWTQTCGNDAIDLTIPATPEPATLALFGLGLAGLAGRRIRRTKDDSVGHQVTTSQGHQ